MGCLRRLGRIALFAALLLAAGCSHPAGFGGADQNAKADGTKPPFRPASSSPSSSTSANETKENPNTDATAASSASSARPPFSSSPDLAPGTLLTVHLEKSIYVGGTTTASFTALVDEPIVVEGKTVVPRGAGVHGSVEAGRSANGEGDAGVVRLTLDSVTIEETDVPVLTSSLFVRGSPVGTGNPSSRYIGSDSIPARPAKMTYLRKGRHLTFRLSAPASVRVPAAKVDRLSFLHPE